MPAATPVPELETVMPAAADVAALALQALLNELSQMRRAQLERIASLERDWSARVAQARAEAIAALGAADRFELLESAAQRLAVACARRELPQPARAAAYGALVAVIASDLLPPTTSRTLYEAWERGLDGLGESSAIIRGEEVLLHID